MPGASTLRSYFAEFVVVFVGVALAFAVENFREASNERTVGDEYLSAFRQDLTADLQMLQEQQDAREAQLTNARTVLEFFEGKPNDPASFFEAYWPVLWELKTTPNRNTMDEVLSSGSLRLIRDPKIRTGLLDLYATYGQIARLAGLAGHARQVGYALNALHGDEGVPWHRVINAKGEISKRANPDDKRFLNMQSPKLFCRSPKSIIFFSFYC